MRPSGEKPLTIGVFGGSFNPIHLGHALLAITVQQTKAVDGVVLVPVYKHAVKRDLLPFEDRVNMCKLAVDPFGAGSNSKVTVSTIERDVGESNGAMLRGLKQQYPKGTRFLWICGDDFFRWMDRPKGLETLAEVHGLIVQRRLHRQSKEEENGHVFFKEPVDEAKVRSIAIKMDLEIDFVYGELPHFSSTLVRRAPGNWRSFLTQVVVKYLDERPHLLKQLIANLEADAEKETTEEKNKVLLKRSPSSVQSYGLATSVVMRGLDAVHALQKERGQAGLRLSIGSSRVEALNEAQEHTDALLKEIMEATVDGSELANFDETLALALELQRVPIWLQTDRHILSKRADYLSKLSGSEGWSSRLSLVEKFNPRIDVLIDGTIRALTEILEVSLKHSTMGEASSLTVDRQIPELLHKWCGGKEALGRLRAFVCSGGPSAPLLIRDSLHLRERLHLTIATKDRRIARVLSLEAGLSSRLSAPDALHRMLENVTVFEYCLMGSFASTTPLPLVHKLLQKTKAIEEFDVLRFFDSSSLAIDFLLSFARALTASACASA